ncbi:MAG: hypothetical protein ACPL3P_00115 [Anaerolineales bacterium]
MSQDEVGINALGRISLDAYQTLSAPKPKQFSGYAYDLMYYGPFFAMLSHLASHFLHQVFSQVRLVDFWHLSYFCAFQLAVASMFLLVKRWFSTKTAFISSILFSTQPLLWGHAFINPKDIPFMAFFLLSIVSGLNFLDSYWKAESALNPTEMWKQSILKYKNRWSEMPQQDKQHLILTFAGWIAIILSLFFISHILGTTWLRKVVSIFYFAKPSSIAYQIFHWFAKNPNKIPLEHYVLKSQRLSSIIFSLFVCLSATGFIWYMLQKFGVTKRYIRQNLNFYLQEIAQSFCSQPLWIAAFLLGFTTAIRVGGPFAGGIICLLAIWRKGKQAVIPSLVYLMIAALVTYATWPALWNNPIIHFTKSLLMASHFPWEGKLLFMGKYWHADALPWYYVPSLFAIQFTEPVVMLGFIGLIGLFSPKKKPEIEVRLLIILWFVLPVLAILIKRPPLYDNFRQILFLIPPIFLLIGIPIEWFIQRYSHKFIYLFILFLTIFPGIVGYLQLHPYEYAYYNTFVGGVAGAADNFETEYWKTSFRQAIEYINTIAPPKARILIWGATFLVKEYAREDLIIASKTGNNYRKNLGYDYVIVSYRNNKDEQIFPTSPIIYTVQKQGTIFTVVKEIK